MNSRRRILRAGPVAARFDEQGELRYIRAGSREVLRRVYFAVRDAHWGTPAKVISDLVVRDEERSFLVSFTAEVRAGDIHFRWTETITGQGDGTIEWRAEGAALTAFLKNRIGYCVLHPAECAGQSCTVEHTGGSLESGVFPRYVAPHQPFRDLRAIRHEVASGVAAEVRVEGDIFEMEDQRNWSDASFKIYSTPLELPFPAPIEKGSVVRQSVRLSFSGEVPEAEVPDGPVRIELTRKRHPIPEIGFGYSGPLTRAAQERLDALRPAHLRVDMERAAEAAELGIPLECAVRGRVEVLPEATVRRWLLLDGATGPATSGEVAVGTDGNFAEFNRNFARYSPAPAVCFSLNPQVHAVDDSTIVENLEAQGRVLESARQIAPGRKMLVSPVTLKPRTGPASDGSDPRQKTDFAAVWTALSVYYLTCAGASSVTYYEVTGDRGLMDAGGDVYPVYRVFEFLARNAGGRVVGCCASDPRAAGALVVTDGATTRALVANLRGEGQTVEIHGTTLELPGYAWREIGWEGDE